MGFTRVIEILIDSKKPMTGHNMIFDLAFIINQFVSELPENYVKFAALVH